MTSLILCHLVNSIMDRIKVGSLGSLCYIHLTCTCTTFCLGTLLQICLSIPNNITYQLCKTTCMICLFKSITLKGFRYLGISFTVSLTTHGQIHTDLGTLTHKVCLKSIHNLLRTTLSYTYNVLCNI